jgi:hypothetical protein
VVHGPDHVIARLDQLVNFEVEDFDVLVIFLAAREPLPSELEPLGRKVVDFDSIVDNNGSIDELYAQSANLVVSHKITLSPRDTLFA